MGDQVYLDLPTLRDFKDKPVWLGEKFEQDYVHNWVEPSGYANVLAAAPSAALPDDHEYWNNFPHSSPFIQNSHTPDGRTHWREAAKAMFDAFQGTPGQFPDAPTVIDVAPISFFLADMRTARDFDRAHSMTNQARVELRKWAKRVKQERKCGVFVSGQSLLSTPTSALAGKVGDYELADYGDYREVVGILSELGRDGSDYMLLTGDVHWGRVSAITDQLTQRDVIHEVITSPASLVTTIGKDQFNNAVGFIRDIFGPKDPWPRHSKADAVPDFFAQDTFQKQFSCRSLHPQVGNQVALLSFKRSGFGLESHVTYWPIHDELHDSSEVGPLSHLKGL
jgi:hypothetical protein